MSNALLSITSSTISLKYSRMVSFQTGVGALSLNISFNCALQMDFFLFQITDFGAQLLQTMDKIALTLQGLNVGTQSNQLAADPPILGERSVVLGNHDLRSALAQRSELEIHGLQFRVDLSALLSQIGTALISIGLVEALAVGSPF